MPPDDAFVLFAHGARDARWSASLQALATAIRAQTGVSRVRTAFLEIQSPTLLEALEASAFDGARRILVVPVFWAAAGHIENDLPPILGAFRARHPQVVVRALPVLSELPGMLDYVAGAVTRLIGQPLDAEARGKSSD